MKSRRWKEVVARAAFATGVTQAATRWGGRWPLRGGIHLRSGSKGDFLILRYHRVNDQEGGLMIDALPTRVFRRQLEYVRGNFGVLDLGEVLTRLQTDRPLPRRCASITFDDGYSDNFEFAFPILRDLGLPATIFLTAGSVETREPLWFDRVLQAFARTERETLDGAERQHRLRTPEDRSGAAFTTLQELRDLGPEARDLRIEALVEQLGLKGREAVPDLLLSWEQIEFMASGGISFGSHTMTHPILTLCTPERAAWEVTESKRLIEERLQRPVRLFAYPNGKPKDYSPVVIESVRSAGYGLAATTLWGTNSRQGDRFQLRRLPAWPPDIPSFAMILASSLIRGGGNGA